MGRVGSTNTPLLESLDVVVATPDSLQEFTLSEPISAIQSLTIGSIAYEQIPLGQDLAPGQFTYNSITRSLSVYQIGSVPIGTRISILGLSGTYTNTQSIPTTRIRDIPAFFRDWNFSSSAEITINRRLQDHPSLEAEFLIRPLQESLVRTTFISGARFNVWGVGYVILTPPSLESRKSGWIRVSLSLFGEHSPRGLRNPLDQNVRFGSGLSTHLQSNDLPYSGVASSRNTNPTEDTTIRQQLETDALVSGGFLDYHGSRVRICRLTESAIHTLADADVFSENAITQFSGTGFAYQGIPLSRELHNVRLSLEVENTSGTRNERTSLFRGHADPQVSPTIDPNALRSPSLAFDNNGPTKTRVDIDYLNGSPILETEQVWGFVYTSLDTHQVTFTNNNLAIRFLDQTFSSYWRMVRSSQKIYIHGTGGYLIRESLNGTETIRFRAETAELEMAKLKGEWLQASEEDRPAIDAQMALYEYFQVPISSFTDYTLQPFRDYYSDVPDDAEVEPYFAARISSGENFSQIVENPDSTPEEELPPLVVGRIESRENFVRIIRSTPPETFLVSEKNSNSQGPGLVNSAGLETSELVAGRPSVHSRIEIYEDSRNPRNSAASSAKYYLNTPNSLSSLNNPESISFPGVFSPSQGAAAARTLVSLENMRSVTTRLFVRRNASYQVGDRIWWRGYLWIILSISESYKVSKNNLNWTQFQLELGRFVIVPVSLTRRN